VLSASKITSASQAHADAPIFVLGGVPTFMQTASDFKVSVVGWRCIVSTSRFTRGHYRIMIGLLKDAILKLGFLRIAYKVQDSIKAIGYSVSRRHDEYLEGIGADDVPIPPAKLIYLVAGTPDVAWFLGFGKSISQTIVDTLGTNGVEITKLQAVLDFGCGCGRVLRHWHSLEGPTIYGTDYNSQLIRWCRKNLAFAEFKVNGPHPPLAYDSDKFDFVYAISVFTHLSEELQVSWMQELSRVIRPGGYLLMTTHGESRITELSKGEAKEFRAGRLVVKYEEASGMNLCAAYHPQSYVREELSAGYEVIDFILADESQAPLYQDVYLLKSR